MYRIEVQGENAGRTVYLQAILPMNRVKDKIKLPVMLGFHGLTPHPQIKDGLK